MPTTVVIPARPAVALGLLGALLLALALPLVALAQDGSPGPVPDVVVRHAPLVYLHPDEAYYPYPADTYMDRSEPILDARAEPAFHLDAPQDIHTGARLGQAPVYYEYEPGRYIIYWFFYAYDEQRIGGLQSDRVKVHEGDWEHIAIRLGAHDEPIDIAYYVHECEPLVFDWQALSGHEPFGSWTGFWGETHPIVYSALGSHASYPGPRGRLEPIGTECPKPSAAIPDTVWDWLGDVRADATGKGQAWKTWVNAGLVDARGEDWYTYDGLWGPPDAELLDLDRSIPLVERFPFSSGGVGPGPGRIGAALPGGWDQLARLEPIDAATFLRAGIPFASESCRRGGGIARGSIVSFDCFPPLDGVASISLDLMEPAAARSEFTARMDASGVVHEWEFGEVIPCLSDDVGRTTDEFHSYGCFIDENGVPQMRLLDSRGCLSVYWTVSAASSQTSLEDLFLSVVIAENGATWEVWSDRYAEAGMPPHCDAEVGRAPNPPAYEWYDLVPLHGACRSEVDCETTYQVNWRDRSDVEDGYRVYISSGNNLVLQATVPAGRQQVEVTVKHPFDCYGVTFRVDAFNEFGDDSRGAAAFVPPGTETMSCVYPGVWASWIDDEVTMSLAMSGMPRFPFEWRDVEVGPLSG